MSLALYRRYRPATFAEVVGQEHVTEPLMQALTSGRLHHAYLFSGPRGSGKTSCARILARSLNCEKGPTANPCGECDSCVALAPNGPGSIDVIEIDAASHGLVDDARELRERAFFAPAVSRFKVYIVDEAHMVSTAGFNALLKLVEEPPEHVKFVFATTEPEKVLVTIRSRTFHYAFRLAPPSVLREHLAGICAREGIAVDPLVLPLVVRAAAGSIRDALSVLDQLFAAAGPDGVSYATASTLLGFSDVALLDEVVDAFAAGDGAAVFRIVDRVVESGHDPRRFAADVLSRFRDLLVLQAVPDAGSSGLLDAPPDQLERLRAQVVEYSAAALSRAADIFSTGLTEMRGTTSPRLQLELMCARVLLPAAAQDVESLVARLERLERRARIAPDPAPADPAPRAAPAPAPAAAAREEAAPATTASEARRGEATPEAPPAAAEPAAPTPPAARAPDGLDAAAVRSVWADVLDAVKSRKRATHAMLSHAQVAEVDPSTITLTFATTAMARTFESSVGPDVVHDALLDVLGVDWRVRTAAAGAALSPAGAAAAADADEPDPVADREPDEGATAQRRSPEEDALALLEQGLGARVIGELEPE